MKKIRMYITMGAMFAVITYLAYSIGGAVGGAIGAVVGAVFARWMIYPAVPVRR